MATANNVKLMIPVSSLVECFTCSICLEDLTAARVTQCGHVFCEACISESLNLRHACPLCMAETDISKLSNGHFIDQLMQKVNEEKEKASKEYLENLLANNNKPEDVKRPSGDANDVPQVDHDGYSPIETVYRKHSRDSFLAYENYFRELTMTWKKKEYAVRLGYQNKIDEFVARNKPSSAEEQKVNSEELPAVLLGGLKLKRTISQPERDAEVEKLQEACNAEVFALKQQHDVSVALLVKTFDEFMKNFAPPPSLLPVSIRLSVRDHPDLRMTVSVKPTDTCKTLKDLLLDLAEQNGDAITSLGDDIAFHANNNVYLNETTTIMDMKLLNSTEVVLVGTITLKSHEPAVCFSQAYVPDARTDYYRCEDCKKNWICKACTKTCHAGHTTKPFMLNQKPSYGCCYCKRTKQCMLRVAKAPVTES